jgi:hypothetical protein
MYLKVLHSRDFRIKTEENFLLRVIGAAVYYIYSCGFSINAVFLFFAYGKCLYLNMILCYLLPQIY